MDARWTQTPQDSSRTVAIILHPTATFVDILNGASRDGQDLTRYVSSAKHSSADADITFTYNTELAGSNQPEPGELLEIILNGLTLWVGVIDSIQDYSLTSGSRRLTIKAYTRQNMPAWKGVQIVTPLYAAGTPVNAICNDIAAAVGLSSAEIALPIVSTYTVHSNMQLAQMSAWEMLTGTLISSGYDPWINARGQLTAVSRDLARPAAVTVSQDRIRSIGGSKGKSPVSSVRIKWLDPNLTQVVHQDQVLDTQTITAGFFQRHQHREIYFSSDRTQQAMNTYMIVKQSANSGLLPVCSENYTQYSPLMGAIDLVTASWAPRLAIDGLQGIIAASFIPDNVAAFGGGVTIPVGRLVEAASQVGVMLIMMSIGTGIYEIRGQPYDSVHARNTTEAKAKGVPDWLLQINYIENDFTMSEQHAQTFAARELIYQARSATTYKATITDDPRIEVGDILELYDGSRLYVMDYSRDLSSGSPATLDVTGFRADISTKSSIVSTSLKRQPNAPATLTATVISSTEIDLTWTATTETGGSIASYVIYRDGVAIGTVPGSVLAWHDTGLTPATAYRYQAQSIDVLGNEGPFTVPVSAETQTTGGTGRGSGSGFTPSSFAPPFPRTAFMGIGTTSTTHQYNNVGGLLAAYGRYNIFVFASGAEGWYLNAGGGDRETMISTAKSLTTAPLGTKFLIYGENDSYYTSGDPYPTFTTEVKARNWELTTGPSYNLSGPLVTTPSTVYVDYAAGSSSTAYAGTNPSGETPYQYAAHYQFYFKLNKTRAGADASRFAPIHPNDAAPSLDGVQLDNVFVDPRVAADWKRNGTLSTHDNGAYQGTWSDILAQAQKQYFDAMASLITAAGGQQWLCANCGDYAQTQLGNTLTSAGVMNGVLDCMNLEGCIGKSYSVETQHSYADLQANIAQAIAFLKGPKAVILNFCLPNGGSSLSGGLPWNPVPTAVNGQHQWERYFVATALMNDAYCSIQFQTSGYNAELTDLTWPVEYDAYGTQKGYLGNPVDAAQTDIRTWYDSTTIPNVWAREFDGGLAIAIAKTGTGSAAQPTGTITIPGAALGIGSGKSWTYLDGTPVTSAGVTLQASRDGLILPKASGTGGGGSGSSGFIPDAGFALTGTIADGELLTLTGSGFGAQGPTIIAYASLKHETVGARWSGTLDVGNATVVGGGFGLPYVVANSHCPYGKGLVIGLEPTRMGSPVAYGQARFQFPATASERFSASTLVFPSGNDYTHLSNGDPFAGAQFKHEWVYNNITFSSRSADLVMMALMATNYDYGINYQSDSAIPNPIIMSPNETPGSGFWKSSAPGVYGALSDLYTDAQLRLCTYDKIVASPGSGTGNILDSLMTNPHYGTQLYSKPNTILLPTGASPNGWVALNHPGFVQNSGGSLAEADQEYNFDKSSYAILSEPYICTGPGARARIEIGNAPTYDACTKIAWGIIDYANGGLWTDTKIKFNAEYGVFYLSGLSGMYLYITDSNGVTRRAGRFP